MNLSEVARKGRKFRRKSEPDIWYELQGKRILFFVETESCDATVDAEMLTASDWEPEQIYIPICAQDLIECGKIISKESKVYSRNMSMVEIARLFIEQLGLSD